MNEVFPLVHTVSMSAATPGSILRAHRKDPFLALATDHISGTGARSFVILNSDFDRRPSVLFADNWQDEQYYLCYKSPVQFQLETQNGAIDAHGQWWHDAGVIVSVDDALYIRAAPWERLGARSELVNIQTGTLFAGKLPVDIWTFGAWKLWLNGPGRDQKSLLAEFDVRKRTRSP